MVTHSSIYLVDGTQVVETVGTGGLPDAVSYDEAGRLGNLRFPQTATLQLATKMGVAQTLTWDHLNRAEWAPANITYTGTGINESYLYDAAPKGPPQRIKKTSNGSAPTIRTSSMSNTATATLTSTTTSTASRLPCAATVGYTTCTRTRGPTGRGNLALVTSGGAKVDTQGFYAYGRAQWAPGQGIIAIFARGGMRIILYIIAVPFNVFAIYWLITETDFQLHRHFKWKLFLGAFIPVFSVILLAAPTRWRESIPLGILAGTLIGYRWLYAEPRRIAEIRKMAEALEARKSSPDH